MKNRARVNVAVFPNNSNKETNFGMPFVVREAEMTTDLPMKDIGTVVTHAIADAWAKGVEPLNFHVVIRFR